MKTILLVLALFAGAVRADVFGAVEKKVIVPCHQVWNCAPGMYV